MVYIWNMYLPSSFFISILKKFVCLCCFMGRLKYKNILDVPFETSKPQEHSGHRF